jgi:signal transduction histidine kinase
MLELIASTGSHSLEMINELLKSGIDDNESTITVTETDIKSLLYDSVELLQHQAKAKRQIITFSYSGENLSTCVNHEKIWRVFNNLIINAVKFSHVGGTINVDIADCDDHLLVSVNDQGIGIDEKHKDSVFEMFTPNRREGTRGEKPLGIGLSISKRIVKQHKGEIWFMSFPEVGTTFYVALPKYQSAKVNV